MYFIIERHLTTYWKHFNKKPEKVDDAHENDLVQNIQGITFVISPEVLEMTGNITIDYVSQQHKTGFVLTSKHPVSEWSGFGVCAIKG
ncbi:MAG: hypothetical protein BWX52_01982 [Bacteroidetes bacterium ADurb.Bin013]|nr:MAG: hypothetical protein BWX52_01982 [Bacteroidetes bacterium ADurb.Bin013]